MIKNKISFWKKLFFSPFFLFLGIVILGFYFFSISKESYKYYKVSQEVENLKQEIQNLEDKKIQTKKLIQYLKTESFQERQARLELGMKKPNEKVVILPNTSEATENKNDVMNINFENNKDAEENNQKIINPIRWWRYFAR
ncbi:septum formation initiator family protein [Candidatus Kuenenbacteria bacterium]|nr:septum formation initiator family protein [Candidatus Kuenenbacteria bacterium]